MSVFAENNNHPGDNYDNCDMTEGGLLQMEQSWVNCEAKKGYLSKKGIQ